MRFSIRALTPEDQQTVAGWRYAAPYDVYDDLGKGLSEAYRALIAPDGALSGVFCWGEEARVLAAQDVYAAQPGALDFGIGLCPDLCGKGLGLWACQCALDWLSAAYAPPSFRLAVYEWNERAVRVYRRLGFSPLTRRGDFLIMARDERPFRDATRPLQNGMPAYPGDPGFDRHLYYTKEANGWNLSVFSMSAHTGTHIDAPSHAGLFGGVETISPERLQGSVQLLAWRTPDWDALRSPRVLLQAGGRGFTLQEAQRLVDAGVTLVGVDGLSVGAAEAELPVHTLLLQAGVAVLENAAIEGFAPGWYEMRCLPLSMPGSDGAPVRLLLREEAR